MKVEARLKAIGVQLMLSNEKSYWLDNEHLARI